MLHNNMRKAMAAAASGSHIETIASVSNTVEYPETWWEIGDTPQIISATENRLTASLSNSLGWSFSMSCLDGTFTTKWTYNSIAEMNAGSEVVANGDHLLVYLEYAGIEMLPQSTTLTLRNATFENEVVWVVSLTVNPEPA